MNHLQLLAVCVVFSGAEPNDLPPVVVTHLRDFKLPVGVPSEIKADLSKVFLFMSADRGKTWKGVDEGDENCVQFSVRLEKDGEYWFCVQTMDKRGQRTPAEVAGSRPALRLVVQSKVEKK